MRLVTEALVEALRSLTATPKRFGLVLVVVAAAASLLVVREATFVDRLRAEQADRVAQGEHVYVVSVATGASVDDAPGSVARAGIEGADCDALATMPGIAGAGAEAPEGEVVMGGHPDGGYRAVGVSPGMLGLLGQAGASRGVFLGAAAARELGAGDGSLLRLGSETAAVGVLDESGARTALLDRAVLRVRPATEVTGNCYVEVGSISREEAVALLPALLSPSTPAGLSVAPLIDRSELGPTPAAQFDARPDAWLWLVLAAVTVVPWLLVVRSRRGDLGCYAMFGASPAWVALVLVVEWIVLGLLGAGAGMVALAVATGAGADVGPALGVLARYLVTVVLAGVAVSIAVPLSQTRVYETLRRTE